LLTVTKIILLGAVAAVEAEQSEGACRQQEAPLSTLQFKERVPLAHNQPASQPASQPEAAAHRSHKTYTAFSLQQSIER